MCRQLHVLTVSEALNCRLAGWLNSLPNQASCSGQITDNRPHPLWTSHQQLIYRPFVDEWSAFSTLGRLASMVASGYNHKATHLLHDIYLLRLLLVRYCEVRAMRSEQRDKRHIGSPSPLAKAVHSVVS
eukprot:scaffold13431_cov26-Prasinocladus_malaysianus.AAC.1